MQENQTKTRIDANFYLKEIKNLFLRRDELRLKDTFLSRIPVEVMSLIVTEAKSLGVNNISFLIKNFNENNCCDCYIKFGDKNE